jgi:hypothetical protein
VALLACSCGAHRPFDKPSAKYNKRMSEKHEVRATIAFLGESRRIPEPGEKVELHVADGSWQSGFRCLSEPFEVEGEKVVWVAREEEYQQALRERRMPAGDTWPLSQLAATDG